MNFGGSLLRFIDSQMSVSPHDSRNARSDTYQEMPSKTADSASTA